jgi:cell division protease FtsH
LAAIINEAAIAATMADKDYIENDDLEEARDKVRWGRAKKSRVINENEKRVIAYHEAGHALASELVPNADPVHKVSIIPRAQAGGMTMMLPETERHLYSRKYVLAMLQVSLGGRVAEEIACDDISSGASDDIKRATQLARTMVCEWGMSSNLGPIRFRSDGEGNWPELSSKEYSETTAHVIDQEVSKLVNNAYENIKHALLERRESLDRLAAALLKFETLDADEVKRILKGETLTKTTVSDLLDTITNPPSPKNGQTSESSQDSKQ